MICLVHQNISVPGQLTDEIFKVAARRQVRGGIVGIADVDQACVRAGSAKHDAQIMAEVSCQWNFDHSGMYHVRIMINGLKGRRSHDQLFAWTEEGVGSHSKNFSRTAAGGHALLWHFV